MEEKKIAPITIAKFNDKYAGRTYITVSGLKIKIIGYGTHNTSIGKYNKIQDCVKVFCYQANGYMFAPLYELTEDLKIYKEVK